MTNVVNVFTSEELRLTPERAQEIFEQSMPAMEAKIRAAMLKIEQEFADRMNRDIYDV